MDICEPERSSTNNHCLVSTPSTKFLAPEDVSYLRSRGAFDLPASHIQEILIRCYFHHVHPFSPILDPRQFILDYESGRVSILLLWSIFVASASFVDDTLLTQDFYTSRTSLKRSVYQRAKVLYDLNYEQDKITLIQSVFLVGFWYTTSDDRQGPWHWNGIAISLSHTIGLHRLPKLPSQGCGNIQPFWRGLWWSICCREVWLSLGQGRPMRIPLDDMDTPVPGCFDAEVFVPEDSTGSCLKYLPGELSELNTDWKILIKLSITLGTILSTHYRAKSTKPTRSDVEHCEREIRACSYDLPATQHQSRMAASHRYQFRIYLRQRSLYCIDHSYSRPLEMSRWSTRSHGEH